jgi:hypothetical protein
MKKKASFEQMGKYAMEKSEIKKISGGDWLDFVVGVAYIAGAVVYHAIVAPPVIGPLLSQK